MALNRRQSSGRRAVLISTHSESTDSASAQLCLFRRERPISNRALAKLISSLPVSCSLGVQKLCGFLAYPVVIELCQVSLISLHPEGGHAGHPSALGEAVQKMLFGLLAAAHHGQADAPMLLGVNRRLVAGAGLGDSFFRHTRLNEGSAFSN